jgi:electron transport complex protein RnfC
MGTLELHTFGRGGIHPESHKELTSGRDIEALPAPAEVRLPLLQHLGEPAVPIVKKGEIVRRGQKIADAAGPGGVPLHATMSGKIKGPDKYPHPVHVIAPALVIVRQEGEGTEPIEFESDPDWRTVSKEEALARIQEAGIVGLGGAAFPTHRKLNLPPDVKVDTLVINGAECEPYLTSDYRLMLNQTVEVVEGSLAIARIVGVKKVLIGVEADKRPALDRIAAIVAETECGDIEVRAMGCDVRYPQGAERQLVQALTGRVVPLRALPMAVGVVVQNVATAAAVYDAVRFRKPLMDRVLTVSGPGVATPRNVRVPIGTLLGDVIAFCGGMSPDTTRVIAGGPMMGRALPRLDVPVIKGMNGLLLLTGRGTFERGFGPCIQCGRCIEACPLGLEPNQASVCVEAGRPLESEPYGPLDCYECGCCTYVCPAERPLVQFMQIAKSSLRRAEAVRRGA